ncbi:MAG: adenosylhomocysteine nucleosidase [Actinomycetota bacterium]|nr:adenosylhomocysteine nucleosidase [Actinomycetota bacterium]
MRLHRTISPDLPLLVVALEEEAAHLHVSELPVLVTGAGKVNAAVSVATILGQYSPSHLVNLGTAGALHDGLEGTHVIGTVIQHDLDDAALFQLSGLHFGEPIVVAATGHVLATGDAFIADDATRARLALTADLVDMEGYAVAAAAATAGVPVTLVKRVSDLAGHGAARSWSESVDDCAEHLGEWVRANLL